MSLRFSVATCHIVGVSPLSQSRQHSEPQLQGENKDDYDARTWRLKMNVSPETGTVVIPAHGMMQAIIGAARYSSEQIPGQGKKTWTAKFAAGISIMADIDTGIDPETIPMVTISANADGVRGSGKRVTRRFPIMHQWDAKFEVWILDPIITEPVFRKMLATAGMFIGLGRFRPEKGGTNGRFRVESVAWQDNRQIAV
jgi:hypothetical protein